MKVCSKGLIRVIGKNITYVNGLKGLLARLPGVNGN